MDVIKSLTKIISIASMLASMSVSMLILQSCVHTLDNSVSFYDVPTDDNVYMSAIEPNMQSKEAIHVLENLHSFKVIRLTSEVRQAIQNRSARIKFPFTIDDQFDFLVSVRSSNPFISDIKNKKIWNIALEKDGQLQPRKYIKELKQKNETKLFIPGVDTWTREYAIGFGDGAQTGSTLLFSTGRTGAEFRW